MRKLRIIIDLPWGIDAHMGTGAYSETMAKALISVANNHSFAVLTPQDSKLSLISSNVEQIRLRSADLPGDAMRHLQISSIAEQWNADCLFAPATLLPVLKVCKYICTVHDLTFLDHPEFYGQTLIKVLKNRIPQSIKIADGIVAISKHAAEQLVTYGLSRNDDIRIIQQPVRESLLECLSDEKAGEIISNLGISQPFMFHVSNLAPHKNTRFAIESFSKFTRKYGGSHIFVIAGGGIAPNLPPDLSQIARENGVENRIHYIGRVTDLQLNALYRTCHSFLFPSLAEGWGLPVAEASMLGAATIASPFVPAADESQKVPLDIDMWTERMFSPMPAFKRSMHTSHDSGRDLLKYIEDICSGESASAFSRGSPNINYRADVYSPSGFGSAGRSMIECLSGLNLDLRTDVIAKDSIQIASLFAHKLKMKHTRPDVTIHHVPPNLYENAEGKNVGIFVWETDRLSNQDSLGEEWNWIPRLNKLDEIWVPSHFLIDVLKNSGVHPPAFYMPHPIDTSFFSPGPGRLSKNMVPPRFDATWTVFLYVGTWDVRKRPDVLVRAFCSCFDRNSRALLIIKSYFTGDRDRDRTILHQFIEECRMSDAHILPIAGILTDKEIRDLIRSASVFVTASRGEGYCLPAVQSLACGVPVLASSFSSFADYVSIPTKYALKDVGESVKLPGYSKNQQWAEISFEHLVDQLKWVHNNHLALKQLGRQGRTWVLENACMGAVQKVCSERIENLFLNGRPH